MKKYKILLPLSWFAGLYLARMTTFAAPEGSAYEAYLGLSAFILGVFTLIAFVVLMSWEMADEYEQR